MQKLSGTGTAFLEIDGAAVDYELAAAEAIVVDIGYLAAMTESRKMKIQQVQGVKKCVAWRRRAIQYRGARAGPCLAVNHARQQCRCGCFFPPETTKA